MVILIQNTISKFSKTKNSTQKRPPKVLKKSKTYIRKPQIKKFYKTNPPKNGNSDSKYNFIVMKRGPKAPRRARRAPQPSTGDRRIGAQYSDLLVIIYQMFGALCAPPSSSCGGLGGLSGHHGPLSHSGGIQLPLLQQKVPNQTCSIQC